MNDKVDKKNSRATIKAEQERLEKERLQLEKKQTLDYLKQRKELEILKHEKAAKQKENLAKISERYKESQRIRQEENRANNEMFDESTTDDEAEDPYKPNIKKVAIISLISLSVVFLGAYLYLTNFAIIRNNAEKLVPNFEALFGRQRVIVKDNIPSGGVATGNIYDTSSVPLDDPTLQVIRDGNKSEIDAMIKSNADINIHDVTGKTPLIYASTKDDTDVVNALIKAGANVNATDRWNNTPLMHATKYNNKNVATVLIDKGADVNKMSDDGDTALSIAVQNGNVELFNKLLNKGADLEPIDKHGNTPIMKSAINGNVPITKTLINKHVDLNRRNNDGLSALALAAENGRQDVAKLLLESGADPHSVDNMNNDPMAHAKRFNHDGIASLIDTYQKIK